MYKKFINRMVIVYEIMGFGMLILTFWVNEYFDIPHRVFNFHETPFNTTESIIETVIVIILCIFTVLITLKFLNNIKYLEGFLHVCAGCKKIQVEDSWIQIEEYISRHSQVKFSHSMCPDCIKEYYPEFYKDPNRTE